MYLNQNTCMKWLHLAKDLQSFCIGNRAQIIIPLNNGTSNRLDNIVINNLIFGLRSIKLFYEPKGKKKTMKGYLELLEITSIRDYEMA